MSWADGPLVGFDLETTGVDVETARIVTACVAVDRPGEEPEHLAWLADPGIEIPAEAAEVHGITTEAARRDGSPAGGVVMEITRSLTVVNAGLPLVIYNAPYDLTVLDREIRRHGLEADAAGWEPLVVDPLVLDKALDRFRRGSRKLADTCRHYGIRLDDAHDATADTLAAIALARKLASAYPEIARMTLPELHEFQVKAKAEQSASFQDYLRRKGSVEVVDPSWPVIPWKEPQPALHPVAARERLLHAALRCLSATLADEHANADAGSWYADELLAFAARDLVAATDALPADRQPVGWGAR